MILDNGICTVLRRTNRAFSVVCKSWYGELSFETQPSQENQAVGTQIAARVRIQQAREIIRGDVAVLRDTDALSDTEAYYEVTRAYHGNDGDNGQPITDLTLAASLMTERLTLVPGVSATDGMSVSAKAAKGGFTDLTTAVDGSTSVLNAWGLEAGAATDVYNKMIVAQNFGKTTLGELAGSIGQVASTAAGLKISYTEVLAASATMTKGGIATSQSMSMLNQVLANVLKPSAEATKTAKALGLEFDATAVKTKGLAGFLKDIETKAGGNETALAKLFGSVEAYKAVAALAGTQSEDFAAALGEMEKSAGAVDSAFNTVSDTTGNKARAALNRLKNEALQFGNVMLPTLNSLLDKFDGIVSGLESMDSSQYMLANVTLYAGDLLTLQTGVGEKKATLYRANGGVESNAFSLLDIAHITFLQLSPGDNYLSYRAASGEALLTVAVFYYSSYLEV